MKGGPGSLPGLSPNMPAPVNGTHPVGESGIGPDDSQQTGLVEGLRVPKPSSVFLCDVDLQSKFLALAGDHYVVAACSGSGCRGATEVNGLAPLSRYDPIPTPAAEDALATSRRCKESLVLTERKLIAAAEVEYVANIEVGQSPIKFGTEARHTRCPEASLPPLSKSPASDSVLDQV